MSGRLDGKVAVVTGGASGIGRVAATTFIREGAVVVIADVDGVAADQAAAAIGGAVVAVQTDVTDEVSVIDMYAATVSRFGQLDVVLNSAALTDPAHQRRDGAVADLEIEVWERTLAVDLRGTLLCCKHAVPLLVKGGGGSIINISSNSALGGALNLTAYAAAKAGVNSVTRSVATAYGKSGIRCNTISPGGIMSPSFEANVPPEIAQLMLDQCLLPSLGLPQDVADLALFLAGDESSYITGQVLCIDGGALSHLPYVGGMRAAGSTTASTTSDPA